MKFNKLPSSRILKRFFRYDPFNGGLYWREFASFRGLAPGDQAGVINEFGYRLINIKGKQYRAHRIIWKMETGRDPRGGLDHKNCDVSDNKMKNLRESDQSKNGANSRISKNNKTGLKGVSFCKETNRWRAQIMIGRIAKNLGRYKTPEMAYSAYCAAARNAFGEFARFE